MGHVEQVGEKLGGGCALRKALMSLGDGQGELPGWVTDPKRM